MKKYLKMIGKIVLYGSMIFVISLLLSLIFRILGEGAIESFRDAVDETPALSLLIVSAPVLLIYFLISKIRKESFTKEFDIDRINKKSIGLSVTVAVLMGIFSMCLVSTKYVTNNLTDLKSTMDFFYGTGNVIIILLGSVLITPAFEEFLFRGVLFKEMYKVMPVIPALLIQTIIFSLIQPNFQAGVYGFVGGLAFALIYYFTGTLWSTIIVQTASCFVLFLYIRLDLYSVLSNVNDIILFSFSIISALGIIYIYFNMWRNFKKDGTLIKKVDDDEKVIA